MNSINRLASRRRVLKGMLNGAAVTVGLPLLDCFLNENGTALAATATAPSPCFISFAYGLGFTPGRWAPADEGKITTLGPELAALTPYQAKLNVFSGFAAKTDGKPNIVHITGLYAVLTGAAITPAAPSPATVDTFIADTIGRRTRFRSLEVSSVGTTASHSERGNANQNPSEGSPVRFYQRLFGPEFTDPNAAEFKPDPRVALRRSSLSAVTEERQRLISDVGATDRVRLDEYFSSLRELEKSLELQLERPAPLSACSIPERPGEVAAGTDVEVVLERNRLFSGLMAHALACGQTHVGNFTFNRFLYMTRPGMPNHHHLWTHDESVDPKLNYQPNVVWFNQQNAAAIAQLAQALESIKEGPGTLLDRTLVFASTDVGYAMYHSLENIPLLTLGSAGGRFKTGLHVKSAGDTVSRVTYTALRSFGVPLSEWGTESNLTSKVISEVLA